MTSGGSEFLELRVLDLEQGSLLDDRIGGLKFDMPFWSADSEHLVYWRYASANEPGRLRVDRNAYVAVHRLGADVAADRVLAREESGQEGVTLWSEVSPDGRFLLLQDTFGSNRRTSVIDLGDPMNPDWGRAPVALSAEREPVRFAGSVGSTLFFLSRRDAPRGEIVAVELGHPDAWRTVIPEGEHLLEFSLIVGGRIATFHRRHVVSAVSLHRLDGGFEREVELPTPGSTYWLSGTPDHPALTFSFDGTVQPPTLIHHDVATEATRTLDARSIEGLDAESYVSRQVFVPTRDGLRLPLFLSQRRDTLGGPIPTLLYGYGASGAVTAPEFRDDFFAWMRAGGAVALAGVRGGGEYGEEWAAAGQLANKQTAFDDFIAVAEYLQSEGLTTKDQLALLGESNGGLLVGAVMTQRPELFAVVLPVVGVLDALRFPTTTAGPRWAASHGDPSDPEQFQWLYAWSPLHRLREGVCYPATLLVTARNDDLVAPSQSFKFAARLQAVQSCARPTLLRVADSGGHTVSFTDRAIMADLLAFAAAHTGLRSPD